MANDASGTQRVEGKQQTTQSTWNCSGVRELLFMHSFFET
jgi:hypothetical protein